MAVCMATCTVGPILGGMAATTVACMFSGEGGVAAAEKLFLARKAKKATVQHRHDPSRIAIHIQRDGDFLFRGRWSGSISSAGETGGVDSASGMAAAMTGMVIGEEGWDDAGGMVTASDAAPGIETAIVDALVDQAFLNASTKAGTSA